MSQSAGNRGATGEDSSSFYVRKIPITQGQEVAACFFKIVEKKE